jgi:hypothetical protein
MTVRPPDQGSKLPQDWDLIGAEARGDDAPSDHSMGDESGTLEAARVDTIVPYLFSGIADLVVMLAVCAGGLAVVRAEALPVSIWALPWGAALGVVTWAALATATAYIRRATPGMVMMRLAFRDSISPGRLARMLLVAVLSACTLGLPTVALGRSQRLARAVGGSPLEPLP